jgi:chemotaxis protein MotB
MRVPVKMFWDRGFIATMSVLFILLCSYSNVSGYLAAEFSPDAYSIEELGRLIKDYQSQVRVFDTQIKDVENNLNWLELKIKRIEDSGRKVQNQLKASVKKKKEKRGLLKKRKSQLEKVVDRYEVSYKNMKSSLQQKTSIKSRSIETIVGKPSRKVSDLEIAIKQSGLSDWIEVSSREDGCFIVKNTLPILFSSGSASLAKEYHSFLGKLAGFLKPYDVRVFITGYADSDPIKTLKYPSNFELGASRAANIAHGLVKFGLKPNIFKIGTTGEHRFAAKEPSKKKSFQRRAQITVVFSG